MKVVILAGGLGTRLAEETESKPKPMIEIGGKPILWHIMKIFSHYGYNEFIICLGYKGYLIKEYFHHYCMHLSDVTIDLTRNNVFYHNSKAEPWKITLLDTGLNAMTGGRIKAIKNYVDNETFMLTYGDGVANININQLVAFHKNHGCYATLTAVQPLGRFGALDMKDDQVVTFHEKPRGIGGLINGGFFVLEPEVIQYIAQGEQTVWEREPLENLAKDNQLKAYRHEDFWQPMDTLREKNILEKLWESGQAPWKVWADQ